MKSLPINRIFPSNHQISFPSPPTSPTCAAIMSSHDVANKHPLPRRPLGNTGMEVSVIGFGAAPLGGVYEAVTEEECLDAVVLAFHRGINFFDTSPYYGLTKSETVLGKALQRLPRDEIIVATKCGRYGGDTFDFSAGRVTASIHESLARLQLDYVDILHCHDIEFGDLDQIVNETLPALVALRKQGVIRAIGITGLPLKIFSYVLDRVPPGTVDVILSYCHHHIADNTLETLIPYLQQHGVGIINASPMSMGLFTPQGPPSWHPAPEALKQAARQAAEVAASAGISLPKLALSYAVQNPEISTTFVGLCEVNQVNENCDAVLQALGVVENDNKAVEDKVLSEISQVLAPVKNMTWPSGRANNNNDT